MQLHFQNFREFDVNSINSVGLKNEKKDSSLNQIIIIVFIRDLKRVKVSSQV